MNTQLATEVWRMRGLRSVGDGFFCDEVLLLSRSRFLCRNLLSGLPRRLTATNGTRAILWKEEERLVWSGKKDIRKDDDVPGLLSTSFLRFRGSGSWGRGVRAGKEGIVSGKEKMGRVRAMGIKHTWLYLGRVGLGGRGRSLLFS
jgi:hypothetical protein